MSLRNTVAVVFKVIIISTLLMATVATAVNIGIAFSTKDKVDSLASIMKTELSKNNVILLDSLDEYSKQLAAIGASSGNIYVLDSVEIVTKDESGTEHIVTIIDGHPDDTSNLNGFNVIGKPDIADAFKASTKESEYYTKCTGNYGEFVTLRLNYRISYVFRLWGAEHHRKIMTSDVSFDYTVPCLRYMK